MTREAKVGMLTGLGVIVLIGVLLSNYLDPQTKLPGGGTLGGSGGMYAEGNATGTMAPLPAGSGYRKDVLSPASGAVEVAGAPGMGGEGNDPRYAMARGQAGPVALMAGMDTGAAVAQAGPVIQDPVAPIEMGRAPAERAGADGGPPVVMVSEETQVAGTAVAGGESGRTAANVNYVIASGDTLSKIAKKFYHDATPSNIQRIVAANPGVLKNEHTVILAGRKLMIPVAARTLVRAPEPMTGGVVPLPGDSGAQRGTLGSRARDGVPAKTAPTYVVQAGDTLSKIARKLAPGHAAQMVKTLVALNGIKDRDSLEVGMKLKVPA